MKKSRAAKKIGKEPRSAQRSTGYENQSDLDAVPAEFNPASIRLHAVERAVARLTN